MKNVGIFLTVQTREGSLTVPVRISERVLRELREPMELSEDSFSLKLAAWPNTISKYVEVRAKRFEMREEVAREISAALIKKLIEYFGQNDETNGYKEDLE